MLVKLSYASLFPPAAASPPQAAKDNSKLFSSSSKCKNENRKKSQFRL